MSLKKVKLVGGEEILAHKKGTCAGEYCTIHKFSNHHMTTWPQHWRGDRGIMERICVHGVGHPDPDEYRIIQKLDDGTHGCDGCCNYDPRNEGEPNEKESNKMTLNVDDLVQTLATNLMVAHGWKLEDKDKNTVEWDPEREDSQYAMNVEDAEVAVATVFDYLNHLQLPEDEQDNHQGMHHHGDGNWHSHVEMDEEDWEDEEETHPGFKKTVITSYSLNPSLDNIITLGAVRAWLKAVDENNLPDSTELEDAVLSLDIITSVSH